MLDNLHVIITLIAAIIVTLFSFAFYDSFFRTIISIIVTIVIFFLFGIIVKSFIIKSLEASKAENLINGVSENEDTVMASSDGYEEEY